MAQGAKKKVDPEKQGNAGAALREQVALWGGPSDLTVVRFDYTFDDKGQTDYGRKIKRRYYTYVAIWIADQGKWYISGINDSIRRYQTNADFMALLASEKTKRAEVATAFEGFKP